MIDKVVKIVDFLVGQIAFIHAGVMILDDARAPVVIYREIAEYAIICDA